MHRLVWVTGLVLSGFGSDTVAAVEPARVPTIVASVAPLADLARRLAEPGTVISTLIPPSVDDETYEPTPRQIEALERATLVLRVGHPAIGIERRVLGPFAELRPRVPVLALSDDLAGAPSDPHLWMSPRAMLRFATRIVEVLDRQEPTGAAQRHARLDTLHGQVDGLEAALAAAAAHGAGAFVTVHAAFGALAQDFGIRSLAIERDGKEPGMAGLVALVRDAKARGVRLVVTQPGFATRIATTVAAELDARQLAIDPLAADWIGNLTHLAAELENREAEARP